VMPRIGARWQLASQLAISAAVARSIRVPALDELYHPDEGGLVGNPDLAVESSWEGELSASWSAETLALDLAFFGRRVADTILYVNRNAFVIRPENAGVSRAAGVELEAELSSALAYSIWISLHLAGALSLSELEATGERLPTAPWGTFDAELSLEVPLWHEARTLEPFTRIALASPVKANLQGTLEVDRYLRWDAGFSLRPLDGAVLSLLITNLLDDRRLETVQKIPLPGRMFLATLRVEGL